MCYLCGPPFILSTRYPPSPNALSNPGLEDVVYRDSGNLELPAGQLAAAASWGCVHPAGVWASPGRRQFLPGPLSSPYPKSHSSAMVQIDRKSFHPTKQMKNICGELGLGLMLMHDITSENKCAIARRGEAG